jgi:hypothetical protein
MNLKLIAGLAIAAILMGVGSQSFAHPAFADTNQNRAQAKAIAQAAGQEQVLILKEMQEKAKPHPTDLTSS